MGKRPLRLERSILQKAANNCPVHHSLSPNPAEESTTILFESQGALSVRVYDILGKEVIALPADFDPYDQYLLNTSQLSQGIYFVMLKDVNNSIVFNGKLLKN